MDIQHLIDRLEDLIDEGRHMPFSKFTMIDEERALELIDQMRISIPEDIEKAARVLAERDHILAQANEDAARVVQKAREQGEQLIDREATVQVAQSRAANIIEQARQEAEGVTGETDRYILESLSKLEQQLDRMIQEIRAGINHVHNSSASRTQQVAVPRQQSATPAQFAPPPQEHAEVEVNTQQGRETK